GVISPGAAPAGLLDVALDALAPGGRLAFSFNDHALQDHAYTAALARHLADGSAVKLFEENGPHLPGAGLNSTVYVLEKA
ncbi:MAG: methyltransferase type 11, partial [Paracoccaceae bacterium]